MSILFYFQICWVSELKYITYFIEFIISSSSFHAHKSHMSSVYLINILQIFCHRWYSVQVAVISVIFLQSYFFWLPQVYIIKT